MAKKRKKKTPRKGVPPIQQKGEARDYLRKMNALISVLDQATKDNIIDQLDRLSAENERYLRGETTKSVFDEVETIVNQARDDINRRATPRDLEEMAVAEGDKISAQHKQQMQKQLRASLGLDVFAETPQLRSLLSSWTKQNTKLIKSLPKKHLDRVEETLERGFAAGLRFEEMTKQLQKDLKVSKNRAKLIARDQVSALNGQLSRARQEANGVDKFIWRTMEDERVRPEHEELDGQTFFWAKGAPVEGYPGQPINCRCYAEPVL